MGGAASPFFYAYAIVVAGAALVVRPSATVVLAGLAIAGYLLAAVVANLVANGMSTNDIIREYPELASEVIRQALQYASALANEEIGLFKTPAA